jgi:hypothetical protein
MGAYTRGEHGGSDLTALVEGSGALGRDGRSLVREAAVPAENGRVLVERLLRWRAEVPCEVVVRARGRGRARRTSGVLPRRVPPPPGAAPPTGRSTSGRGGWRPAAWCAWKSTWTGRPYP